jgi:hypothetical protein
MVEAKPVSSCQIIVDSQFNRIIILRLPYLVFFFLLLFFPSNLIGQPNPLEGETNIRCLNPVPVRA